MGPLLFFAQALLPKIMNSKPSRPAQEARAHDPCKKKRKKKENSAVNLTEKVNDEGKKKERRQER